MSEMWIALEALGPGLRFIGPFDSQAEAEEYGPLVAMVCPPTAEDVTVVTVVRAYPETRSGRSSRPPSPGSLANGASAPTALASTSSRRSRTRPCWSCTPAR
jgi:hypothetical protein